MKSSSRSFTTEPNTSLFEVCQLWAASAISALSLATKFHQMKRFSGKGAPPRMATRDCAVAVTTIVLVVVLSPVNTPMEPSCSVAAGTPISTSPSEQYTAPSCPASMGSSKREPASSATSSRNAGE
eukprot:CAMPEP_0195594430 /NCGR_PEP_ID=MMETSP0815-20121206/1412_1 /TAXON_ID=97485 /ORGANISM="Prymnesium parvum, Strain Texoma1" /LENGTH=125 /DNA_ID=CAMNT_0040733633 /DNA_START=89 /DNA_END=466 /DNA_ORIENTATION=+